MANTQGATIFRHIRRLVTAQVPSQQSDLQLLQQFIAERDEAAFAALVQRHGNMVLGVCRTVLHHQQDAEDAFQAAFLVLARKAHTIRKQESLSSWLHGVAYRLALKARSRRRDPEPTTREAFAASPIDDLTMRELRAILHEELHGLAEQYRSSLLLCYWEGKTRDEAAELLGMTAGAFKKCLERARNLLGSRLVRRGLVPSAAFFASLFTASGVKAALPNVLITKTAQAAIAFATGKTGASAAAVALANGVIQTMNLTKWATAIVFAILLAGLGAGVSLAAYHFGPGDSAPLLIASDADQPPTKAKAGPPKNDQERIVGFWRIAEGMANGQPFPDELATVARLVFTKDGGFAMVVLDDDKKKGTYKIVGAGKIDITADQQESPSIYKFDGDNRLSLCISQGKERPAEFAAAKGTSNVLFALVRVKPGEEKPKLDAKDKAAIDKLREAANRQVSANNLKQIGLAMHNYHDTHKGFPTHAIYSKDGKTPLLSWRVAILPYIEHHELYREFKLDEPWDSAHNKKLIAKMPKIYEPGSAGKAKKGETYYQVFTGPETAFQGAKKLTVVDITDGTSNTILAVEAKEPVVWTKPADLTLPKDKDKLPAVGGLFSNGFNVLMGDGSVRTLPLTVPAATFRAYVTPKGAEVIE